jgi:hypothetical protein
MRKTGFKDTEVRLMCERSRKIEEYADELWDDEGTWFEFLDNLGCAPSLESQAKELYLNVKCNDTKALNVLRAAFAKWCLESAEGVADVKGW